MGNSKKIITSDEEKIIYIIKPNMVDVDYEIYRDSQDCLCSIACGKGRLYIMVSVTVCSLCNFALTIMHTCVLTIWKNYLKAVLEPIKTQFICR